MRKALQINIDGTTTELDLEAPQGSLRILQGAVGGWIQAVDISDNLTMWVNEEGKLEGLLPNEFGTRLFSKRFGEGVDVIVGNIVLTGGTDDEGETLGLTDEQVKSFSFIAS